MVNFFSRLSQTTFSYFPPTLTGSSSLILFVGTSCSTRCLHIGLSKHLIPAWPSFSSIYSFPSYLISSRFQALSFCRLVTSTFPDLTSLCTYLDVYLSQSNMVKTEWMMITPYKHTPIMMITMHTYYEFILTAKWSFKSINQIMAHTCLLSLSDFTSFHRPSPPHSKGSSHIGFLSVPLIFQAYFWPFHLRALS